MKKLMIDFYHKVQAKRVEQLKKKHETAIRENVWQNEPDYHEYIDNQLRRTLKKKDSPLRPHTILLVDRLSQMVHLPASKVLCVGCRNTAEIDYLESKGAADIVGIDIYSEDERIKVMDMHQMTFADSQFDVVYSTHSLEHAYDPQQAAREFIRVSKPGGLIMIELPFNYLTSNADLLDIGSPENLHALFEPAIAEIVWTETAEPRTDSNQHGTPIIRTAFFLK